MKKKCSEETKRKLSEARKGKMPKNIDIIKNYWIGKKHKEESKIKMSESHKGKVSPFKGISIQFNTGRTHFKKGMAPWNKGIKWLALSGEKHPCYLKDRKKLQRYKDDNTKDRRSSMYRDWRKQVWLRDNYKCKIDNCDCSGKIQAHHILSWREYPELRYEINNGITLCHAHHPRRYAEEKRLIPVFTGLVTVSNRNI